MLLPSRPRSIAFAALLVLAIIPPQPGKAAAQETCPDGFVSQVLIVNHSLFPPEELPEDGRLRWAYRLTNALRFRTRQDFIRNQLLLEEGECFDEDLVRESGRILREFQFLSRAEVTPVRQVDGGVDLEVETRDEWSTKASLDVRFQDGLRFQGGSLVEENLLGRGITLGFFRTAREAEESTGGNIEIPGIMGSGWDMLLGGHRGRIGSSLEQALIHPFEGEVGRTAFRQSVRRSRDLFPYTVPLDMQEGEAPFSHVVVPLVVEGAEISAARRWGEPGDLLVILGGGITYERVGPGWIDEAEGVRDGRFGDRTPIPEDEAEVLAPQLVPRQAFRLNVLGGFRKISYQYRYGLDTVTGVQDFPVGRELLFSMGRSMGHTGPGRPGDVFAGASLRLGWGGTVFASYLTGTVEGRRQQRTGPGLESWGDLITETHGFFYWQPYHGLARTIVVRATLQGGWQTSSPFQLTLGGESGVRGYGELDLPVGRKAVVSLENRGKFPGPFPGLIDLGFTLFGDVGQGWAGDVPLARDTGWRGTLGAGLRIGFPAGSSSVIRADVAFPIGPTGLASGPIFRISAREAIGILDDFRSPDVARSRHAGISPDYVGAARTGTIP